MKESRRITPLRTILRNCLNHIENLETNRSICDNYDKEFQDLKQFSETLKIQKEFACTEGEKEVNRKKNRYKDILPFNVSRVVLNEYAGIPGSDYINANFIKGASGSPAYIASQGPLPNTVNDFWRMVVECEVQVIVMACNAQESGKHKCENYWVEKEGEEKRFGMVQICLVKASIICPDFLVRTMQLKYTNDKDVTEERTVCQFHYSAWPDHGVPPLVRPLLDMVRLVRDTQASETLPVLVHCSAGCGRTGTICAIDFVWGLLRAGKLTEDFSLFNLVRDMRKQRVAMVQTKEQYILVHQAVRELFKEQLQVIESHPYENIDFNGVPLIKDFEEPFYDTICIKKEENCDEKQDKSEMKEKGEEVDSKVNKADTAPPLPRKKRPNVLFSKQEKEAENLTEKNRSFFTEKEKEKTDASLSSILGKPRIVKLRALFEKSPVTKERSSLKDRGNQTVSRSHSLGAIKKPITTEVFESPIEKNKLSGPSQQPSFDSGKLKQSKPFSKSVPLIKRSKSLKSFTSSSHLSVPLPVAIDPKTIKTHSSKPQESDNSANNGSENFWQKPIPFSTSKPYEIPKECSKRRRSLESLMGDTPPTITWPNVMMSIEKDINIRGKVKSDQSPTLNSHTIQGNKTADLIRQQLQRLSIETEKKVNNLASGLGTRERRNSFRQAVSKSDFQNVFRNFHEHPPGTKKPMGSEYFVAQNLESSKNKSDFLQYIDQREETKFLDREGTLDVKLSAIKGKPFFDGKKLKLHESILVSGESAPQGKKHNIRQQTHEHSASIACQSTSNHVLDPRIRKVMPVPKNPRSDELERNIDSKNLFLKKLNSEILSERERDHGNNLKHNDTRFRSDCEDFEKPGVSHFGSIIAQADLKKPPLKTNFKSIGYAMNSENYDKLDGPKSKPGRSIDVENNEKLFQPWPNSNFHGPQILLKGQKSAKPAEDFKCYVQAPISNPNFHNRANFQRKGAVCQNSSGDCSYKLRRNEPPPPPPPQNVRPKDPFFSFSHKKNVASTKACSSLENETLLGSYRRNPGIPNSELYLTVNSDYENGDKKLILSSKSIVADKSSKTFDCLPWTHSVSSRSSGEASSSDQHSTKSDSSRLLGPYDNENAAKSDAKILKNTEQSRRIGKIRPNDSSINSKANDLSNGSSKQRKPEEVSNSAVEFCNYGIVATSILRKNSSKYSKDDFVLEEPTAPPRVKRHASVTIPRNIINNSDHVSTWVAAENKIGTDRNTTLEDDKNAWSGSFGVDLDAVAASMQQGESSVLKNSVWPGKNHLSTSSSSTCKKKQHYF